MVSGATDVWSIPPFFPHSAPTHVNPRCDDVTNLTVDGVERFTPAVRHIHVKNLEECGLCPVFAGFTLEFALQLRKKHGKTLVRVKTSVSLLHVCKLQKYVITNATIVLGI